MQETDQHQHDALHDALSVTSSPHGPEQTPRHGTPAPQDVLSQLVAAVAAMRPKQWSKNGLVLLALVFSRQLTDVSAVERVLLAFFAFSFAASAIYIVNDISDRESDRIHPRKSLRPIASGRLPLRAASRLERYVSWHRRDSPTGW